MKLPGLTRKFWIVIATIIVVGLMFAYYLLVYVGDRRAEVIAQNYRMLKRIGDNSVELMKYYEVTIRNYKSIFPDKSLLRAADSAQLRQLLKAQDLHCISIKRVSRSVEELNWIYFQEKTTDDCVVRTSAADFLAKSMPQSSCFDDFFLVRIIRTKNPASADSLIGIAYQTFYNRIEIKKRDSLFSVDNGLESTPVIDVHLFGVPYKIFTNRIQVSNNESWVLCGAVKTATFNRKIHEVDTYTISIAILVLLFVLLSMPILKLVVMNAVERLRIVNVWFTGFSIIVGTAVIVLLLVAGNHFFSHKGVVKDDLTHLSDAVKGRFLQELRYIYTQLDSVQNKAMIPAGDSVVAYENFFNRDAYFIRKKNKPQVVLKDERDVAGLNKKFHYPFTNQVMWLDARGDQLFTLATQSVNSFNLGTREYFIKARNGDIWTLPGKDGTRKFSLQSIRSFRSGRNAAGFGIPLDHPESKASVLAMSSKLHSIMDPLLPPGFGYCIIGSNGDVWFHSDRQRNMQENFLEETQHDEKMQAAIAGRMKISIDAPYDHRMHQMYIQPVDSLPLYLVTFYDLDYYKSPLVLTIGYACMLIFLMFALMGIQLLLQFVSVYRPTKLKIRRFYLSWLRPRKMNEAQSRVLCEEMREKYTRSILTLTLLTIVSLSFLWINHNASFTFGLLVLPLYILVFQYLLFERENMLKKDADATIIRHSFVWLSIIFIALVNFFIAPFADSYCIAGWIQLLFIAILAGGYFVGGIKKIAASDFVRAHQQKLYFVMIFLWLALVSVLPVIGFYRMAYHEESLTWTKYLQWNIALDEEQRNTDLKKELAPYKDVMDTLGAESNYLDVTGNFRITEALEKGYSPEPEKNRYTFEFLSRPPLSKILNNTFPVLQASAGDGKWCWYETSDECNVAMMFAPNEGAPRYYTVARSYFDLRGSNYFVLFIILLLGFFYLIYHVTLFAVRNIFGLGVVLDSRLLKDSLAEVKQGDLLNQHRIFIVGLPYAGKELLLNNFSCVINCRTDLAKPIPANKQNVLVIKHFEHGVSDHKINDDKLKIIQQLIDEDRKIIIASAVQPGAILEFYEKELERIKPDSAEWATYRHAEQMWKNVLTGFVLYFQPLSKENTLLSDDAFIKSELNHGLYLPTLVSHIPNETTNTYPCQENFVLKIEELADTYYHSLWNSFSDAEKFLLHDLAKDRYVNLKNVKTIRLLLQKGVIVADDSLQIMNRSFNNFILSVVNEDEEVKMEKEQSDKGSWNIVQSVLIILLIALIAFIAIAQQDLFRDLNVLIGAFGSAIALITRFGGLFSSKPKDT
jgi:Ca2+/Na+ antiporter